MNFRQDCPCGRFCYHFSENCFVKMLFVKLDKVRRYFSKLRLYVSLDFFKVVHTD